MKTIAIASLFILFVGCSTSGRSTTNVSSDRPQAMMLPQEPAANAPTVILAEANDPMWHRQPIYEDAAYIFVARDYGWKGNEQIPGLFVFSHKMNKWMEIKQLSTKNAKLGRSPTYDEGQLCSVMWDYSNLQKADYAAMPLGTSGSLNFPDNILYHADTNTYLLQFNSSWNINAVLTQFIVRKDHIDKAFGDEDTMPCP